MNSDFINIVLALITTKKNLLLEDWVFRLVWVFSRYSFFVSIKIDDYVGELTTLFGFRFK